MKTRKSTIRLLVAVVLTIMIVFVSNFGVSLKAAGDYWTIGYNLAIDVNGDKKDDLVRLWEYQGNCFADVDLGKSGGGFESAGDFKVGGWAETINVLTGDINGDGRKDLIRLSENQGSCIADVDLGNTDGSFTSAGEFNVGGWASYIKPLIMDVNGDKKDDLVRLWEYDGKCFADTDFGTSTGSFEQKGDFEVGGWGDYIQAYKADINGDGKQDLVRLWKYDNRCFADIDLGTENGFKPHADIAVGPYSDEMQVITADVNGDKRDDIIRLLHKDDSCIADIDLGNQDGTLKSVPDVDLGFWGDNIKTLVLDINADGKSDIARLWQYNGNCFADVDIGNANGGFTHIDDILLGGWGNDIEPLSGDFNGDGKYDIVRLWNYGGSSFADLDIGNSKGGFEGVGDFKVGGNISSILFVSPNKNSELDLGNINLTWKKAYKYYKNDILVFDATSNQTVIPRTSCGISNQFTLSSSKLQYGHYYIATLYCYAGQTIKTTEITFKIKEKVTHMAPPPPVTFDKAARYTYIFGYYRKGGYSTYEEALKNIVTVEVPVWKYSESSGGKYAAYMTVDVNKKLAEDVKAIFSEIFNDSEKFPIKDLSGWRWPDKYVNHPCGTAIDINYNENMYIKKDSYGNVISTVGSCWLPNKNIYSMPPDGSVVRAFKRHGWEWGGSWSNPKDYMHFSYLGG